PITIYIAAFNNKGKSSDVRIDNIKITGCKAPPAPTAASPQTFCAGATVASLVATKEEPANTVNWYDSATSGTPLSSAALLSTGTYYVSQTNSCELTSPRTPVSVTVN